MEGGWAHEATRLFTVHRRSHFPRTGRRPSHRSHTAVRGVGQKGPGREGRRFGLRPQTVIPFRHPLPTSTPHTPSHVTSVSTGRVVVGGVFKAAARLEISLWPPQRKSPQGQRGKVTIKILLWEKKAKRERPSRPEPKFSSSQPPVARCPSLARLFIHACRLRRSVYRRSIVKKTVRQMHGRYGAKRSKQAPLICPSNGR